MLIDAYNVMFADGRIGPLLRRDPERARDEFLALVAQRAPHDGTTVIVVFDATRAPRPATEPGRIGQTRVRGLQVVYARESADTWIRERIGAASEPATITLVTSDREILATAAAHGAGILRVAEFLQLAARGHRRARELRQSEKPDHVGRREVEEWEKLFDERPKDDE
jgi:predicted RNA-binding protein with PIN domain